MTTIHVQTRDLDRETADALLRKHHVACIALAFHDRVTIALVNYVYVDGSIFGRMEDGPDLTTLRHHPWVALEVSEIDGLYDWRSVAVRGSLELLSDTGATKDSAELHAAVERLRAVVPAVFTPRDPMPRRVHVFRLYVDEVVGRRSDSDARRELPPA